MRLLLVEDTPDVAEAIVASFSRRGDAVDHASTAAEAVDAVAVQDYDAAILDV
jgi:two-component system response regulator TctD